MTELFSRPERARIRGFEGLACERELDSELARLAAEFRACRAGKRSPHDLCAAIQAFLG